MTTNRVKISAIIIFAIALVAGSIFKAAPTMAAVNYNDDAATTYKAKCLMCHTATAAKFFDATKPDADLAQTIIKGKKGEKPPFMPAFEGKVTADDAKALAAYMKTLKTAGN